jgi:hypothetical protein
MKTHASLTQQHSRLKKQPSHNPQKQQNESKHATLRCVLTILDSYATHKTPENNTNRHDARTTGDLYNLSGPRSFKSATIFAPGSADSVNSATCGHRWQRKPVSPAYQQELCGARQDIRVHLTSRFLRLRSPLMREVFHDPGGAPHQRTEITHPRHDVPNAVPFGLGLGTGKALLWVERIDEIAGLRISQIEFRIHQPFVESNRPAPGHLHAGVSRRL